MQTRLLWSVLIAIGAAGIGYNLFQIIIIISGNYNQNPDITSPVLRTLDAIALTGFWLIVSIAIVVGALYARTKSGR